MACLSNKRKSWSFRLYQEFKDSNTAKFITYTYDEENLPYNEEYIPILYKKDAKVYIKRLREALRRLGYTNLRYYLVGEYGSETSRPHYHALLFNVPNSYLDLIVKKWDKGHVYIGDVTIASISYVAKYHITRNPKLEHRTPEFALMSKGIGKGYLKRLGKYHEINRLPMVHFNGRKMAMPRYFKEKLFSKYTLYKFAKENVIKQIEISNQYDEECYAKNLNPDSYKIQQYQDFDRRIKNVIKNEKL
jgi:hypothetical protein